MRLLILLMSSMLLSACGTTQLTEHWQDDNFSRNDFNNALIIAVTSNTENRFLFEVALESALKKAGLNGDTSIKTLGRDLPTKEQVEEYLKTNNYDFVVATKLAAIDVEKDYVPPKVRTYYTGPYYPTFGHYYGGYSSSVTLVESGYVDTQTTTILVTTIFDAKTGAPVWVGRTKTLEAKQITSVAAEIAKSVWSAIEK